MRGVTCDSRGARMGRSHGPCMVSHGRHDSKYFLESFSILDGVLDYKNDRQPEDSMGSRGQLQESSRDFFESFVRFLNFLSRDYCVRVESVFFSCICIFSLIVKHYVPN